MKKTSTLLICITLFLSIVTSLISFPQPAAQFPPGSITGYAKWYNPDTSAWELIPTGPNHLDLLPEDLPIQIVICGLSPDFLGETIQIKVSNEEWFISSERLQVVDSDCTDPFWWPDPGHPYDYEICETNAIQFRTLELDNGYLPGEVYVVGGAIGGDEPSLIHVIPSKPEIKSIKINRNPSVTTYNGFSTSAPPIQGWVKLSKLGVWAEVIISNPTSEKYIGKLRAFSISPNNNENQYFKLSLEIDAYSEKTYYIPIYGGTLTGTWNFRIIIGKGLWWYDWETYDEKIISIDMLGNIPLSGPKHFGNLVPISEFLSAKKPSLTDLAFEILDFFILLAQSRGSAYVIGDVLQTPKSLKYAYPGTSSIVDLAFLSQLHRSSTHFNVKSKKITKDTFTLNLRASTSIVYEYLEIIQSSISFTPTYDRVRIIVELPQGITLLDAGDSLEAFEDDQGNTYLHWVELYCDKMFDYGTVEKHSIDIKLEQPGEYSIRAYAYFEVGPFGEEPTEGVFPILDYDKWNTSPESVYWIEFTSIEDEIILKLKTK